MGDILSNFEIGYDRDYSGVELHCLLCSTGQFGNDLDCDLRDGLLSEVISLAENHLSKVHDLGGQRE